MTETLPLFQYPTTIVWLDDDSLFLRVTELALQTHNKLKTFSDSEKCLNFFNCYQAPLTNLAFMNKEANHENYYSANHIPIDFNVSSIVKLREHKERINEISLFVCDHLMPKICGLTLCSKLQKFPMKKIMLTGIVKDDEAIQAFNEGVIDKFIRKNSPTLHEELNTYINKLIRQYFCEKTNALLSHLETEQKLPLSDPMFIAFFDDWCSKNDVKEFYLIDKCGSFLLVNSKNKINYFVLHTEKSLNDFTKIYDNVLETQPLIQSISNRTKIPFFGDDQEAWKFQTNDWHKYLYTPNIFDGRERYYWSIV